MFWLVVSLANPSVYARCCAMGVYPDSAPLLFGPYHQSLSQLSKWMEGTGKYRALLFLKGRSLAKLGCVRTVLIDLAVWMHWYSTQPTVGFQDAVAIRCE